MSENIPVPEFNDEEERRRYFAIVATMKQEYINNMVMILFLTEMTRVFNNDTSFKDLIERMTDKFQSQMVAQLLGREISDDEEEKPFESDDPDVERILGGIFQASGREPTLDDLDDDLIRMALGNVCEVYKNVLSKQIRRMSDNMEKHKKDLGL